MEIQQRLQDLEEPEHLNVIYFSMHDIYENNCKIDYYLKPRLNVIELFHKHEIFTMYQLLGYFLVHCKDCKFSKELENAIPAFETWLQETIQVQDKKDIHFITCLVYNKIYQMF